jgi:hypothetical protein
MLNTLIILIAPQVLYWPPLINIVIQFDSFILSYYRKTYALICN